MERIQVLNNSKVNLNVCGDIVNKVFDVKEEDRDMRRYINRFKERDFKLRRIYDAFIKGWSCGSAEVFFKDGRSIF